MSTDIESLVSAAVEKALGGSPDKATPTAAPSKASPAPAADDFNATFRQYMQFQMAREMAKESGYQSPGGSSGGPAHASGFDPGDPRSLNRVTADEVTAMRRDGSFKANLQKYRDSLPGGGGDGLFKNRLPK
jgi:hypothetical protein